MYYVERGKATFEECFDFQVKTKDIVEFMYEMDADDDKKYKSLVYNDLHKFL